jgi:hypothetical protein
MDVIFSCIWERVDMELEDVGERKLRGFEYIDIDACFPT